jgi:hypothetical protein
MTNYDDSGLFFECQVVKQLRIFCDLIGAKIFFYRDINYIEVDVVVEYENKISMFEIKVGSDSAISDAIKNFNKIRNILTPEELKRVTS